MDSTSSQNGGSPKETSTKEPSSNMEAASTPVIHSPPMGDPGHGNQPHHAYPLSYIAYPYEHPHHQGYKYPPPTYYGLPHTDRPNDSYGGFIRVFILSLLVLFSIFFVATILTTRVIRPKPPIYKLISLSVKNFNATKTSTAIWESHITIENPNDKLEGYFGDLKVDFLYKRNVIAAGYAPGFQLCKHERRQIIVKSASDNVGGGEPDGLAKEQESGSAMFDVRIASSSMFESGSIYSIGQILTGFCQGLRVVFKNNTSNGTWENGGGPMECNIYA